MENIKTLNEKCKLWKQAIGKAKEEKAEQYVKLLNNEKNLSSRIQKFNKIFQKAKNNIPTLTNPDTGKVAVSDQEKVELYGMFCKYIVEEIKLKESNFALFSKRVKNQISWDNISHTEDDLSLGNITYTVKSLQLSLPKNNILRTDVLDLMPQPSKLALAVYNDFSGIRDKTVPFNRYIFDLNFDSDFRQKIEKQVDELIIHEKDKARENITHKDKFNKILHKHITLKEVQYAIKLLKNNKSPRSDKIFNEMIKNGGEHLHKILSKFYNKCLDKYIFPTKLKESDIIPLYKKKRRSIVGNYRPVKLLSIIGKIFERIIVNRLQPYLEQHFICKGQAGFIKKFSTDEQIIYTFEKIKIEIGKNGCGTGVFLYISKAFDRVWRKGLLYKLYKQYGIKGRMFLLLVDYLTNRKSRVRVWKKYSSWFDETLGVPQGSVLGPLLFLLYINDMLKELKCNNSSFADDIFVFTTNGNAKTRSHEINQDMQIINNWLHKWRVIFDGQKFKCIDFYRSKCLSDNPIINKKLKFIKIHHLMNTDMPQHTILSETK